MTTQTDSIVQLYQADQKELALQLMLGANNCKYRIFGTIGHYVTKDKKVKEFVETFILIENISDIESLKALQIRHTHSPQIHYKCFIFNIQEKALFEYMQEEKQKDSYEFAAYIEKLNPQYFKL